MVVVTIMSLALTSLIVIPEETEARRNPAAHLSMKDARSATLTLASMLSEFITESEIPIAKSSSVGKCERLTGSQVRCRFAAYGTYQTCRGWGYIRTHSDDFIGWAKDVECT